MITGTVKFFNPEKGWGFIKPNDGSKDLFCHFKDITADGYKTLKEGDKVEFNSAKGAKGMCAKDIRLIANATAAG